jgi:hypothetical protein
MESTLKNSGIVGKRECHVVIPTHKHSLTGNEELALVNNLQTLSQWPSTILLPFGVPHDYYISLARRHKLKVIIKNLPPGFLGSIEKYNRLLLSPTLYEMFLGFKYILIAQTDVWIFRDELQYWIDKNFDYIGAPLFLPQKGGKNDLKNRMLPYGGNGGLCLRNVEKTMELTLSPQRRISVSKVLIGIKFLLRYKNWKFVKIFFYSLRKLWKDPKAFREQHQVYEDVMFSIFYAIYNRNYRVAPSTVSLGFSIEMYSSELLDSYFRFTSPFGLHGYDKYLSEEKFEWLKKNDKLRSRSYVESNG